MDLNNYLMLPTQVEGIGNVYPVRLKDWEEFNKLSHFLYIHGLENLKNLYDFQGEYSLDYRINRNSAWVIYKRVEDDTLKFQDQVEEIQMKILKEKLQLLKNNLKLPFSIEDIEKAFEIVTRQKVKFEYIFTDEVFEYAFRLENGKSINKYNFDELRKVVMRQNVMFEPLSFPDKLTNEIYNKTMEAKFRRNKSKNKSFENIIAMVSIERSVSDEEILNYTYYRIMKDFYLITRKQNNIYNAIFMSQCGTKGGYKIEAFDDEIEMYKNPYEDIFGDEISTEEIEGSTKEPSQIKKYE